MHVLYFYWEKTDYIKTLGLICIFQAVCQFFFEYLIILAQRGKNRPGD